MTGNETYRGSEGAKRRVAVLALAVGMLAIVVLGTSAYFTDAELGVNRYAVAGSGAAGPGDDADFSIELSEESPDGSGVPDGSGGLLYDGVVPGASYGKEVSVANTSADACAAWVRAHVTVTKADAWAAVLGHGDVSAVYSGTLSSAWEPALADPADPSAGAAAPTDNGDGSLTYTYYLKAPLSQGAASPALFTHVSIPAHADSADMASVDGFQLVVWAEAVGADGLPQEYSTCQRAFALWQRV